MILRYFIIYISLFVSPLSYGDCAGNCSSEEGDKFNELLLFTKVHNYILEKAEKKDRERLENRSEDEVALDEFMSFHKRPVSIEKKLEKLFKLDNKFIELNSTNLVGFNVRLVAWREKTFKNIVGFNELSNSNPEQLVEKSEVLIKNYLELSSEFGEVVQGYMKIFDRLHQRDDLSKKEIEMMIMSAKASLATNLMMFENSILAMRQFKKLDSISLELTKEDLKKIHDLKLQVEMEMDKYVNSAMMQKDIVLIRVIRHDGDFRRLAYPDEEFLDLLIDHSAIKYEMEKAAQSNQLNSFRRFLNSNATNLSGMISKRFGSKIGSFSFEDGKLNKMAEVERKSIEKQLKPLDILFDKTTNKLTDSVIPGHFGHVAIWVGSEAELKELGMWEDELIKPHQKDIRAGKRIIESLQTGVQISSLDEFLNVDDLAVVSNDNLSLSQKKKYLKNAFSDIGKGYDFHFDIETTDKLYCSETIYHIFSDYAWPRTNVLNRATMAPDQIVQKAITHPDFNVTLFYHDGKKVDQDKVNKLITDLME